MRIYIWSSFLFDPTIKQFIMLFLLKNYDYRNYWRYIIRFYLFYSYKTFLDFDDIRLNQIEKNKIF